jgi:hypothetical protein
MAARRQDSYATLEGKVVERTQQLELANFAKARFLAAASHDQRDIETTRLVEAPAGGGAPASSI